MAFSDARVVIYSPGRDASTAESLATLIEGMARLAWPAIIVRDPAAALDLVRNSAVPAVMIDARSDLDAAISAAMALRTHLRPRATPIVGLGAAAAGAGGSGGVEGGTGEGERLGGGGLAGAREIY